MAYHPPYLPSAYPPTSTEKKRQALVVVESSCQSLRDGLSRVTDHEQRKSIQTQLDRAEKEKTLYQEMLQTPTKLLSSPFVQILQYIIGNNGIWHGDELICEIYPVAQELSLAVLSYLELKYPIISAYFLMVLHTTPPLFTDVYLHYENPSRAVQFHLCPVDDVRYPMEQIHQSVVWKMAQAYSKICKQTTGVICIEFYTRDVLVGKLTYRDQTKEVICKISGMTEVSL